MSYKKQIKERKTERTSGFCGSFSVGLLDVKLACGP